MPCRKPNLLLYAAIVGGFCYPLLVYFFQHQLPTSSFLFLGLILIGLRLLALRQSPDFKLWASAFALASLILIITLFAFPTYAAQAYPVAISLAVAAIFALSLIFPPTLVERIARLSEPDLPPSGVRYTRKVTIVWLIFLLSNAALSMGLALWGTVATWTLWTGCLSYIVMGLLFAGEYAVRRVVRQ